ncbi:MAG: hypothetical protein ACR2H6_07990 [Pyrinomonadaceae bacterium]
MFTNVNLAAPLGALALLGTGFLFLLLALAFVLTLVKRKFRANKSVLVAGALIAAAYVGVLLIFSLKSSEQALARGQEKHFCEIDCHLAYSIVDVTDSKTLGAPPQQAIAAGTFRSITIKTRFDENTISPNRGTGLLYPNSRVVTLIDEQGRKYLPSSEGQRVLEQNRSAGTAMTSPLRPGESYATTVVFDLPADARNPSLLINEGEWLTHFVIGHENSPFHKLTKFQL